MTTVELYDLAEQNGIVVDDFPLDKREALSLMDTDGNCYVAIDHRKLQSDADEKTRLAHELGHCLTGAFYNVFSPLDSVKRCENRADKWAATHLIKRADLDAAVKDGCTEMWQLADRFGVSEDLVRKAVSWYTYGNLYSVPEVAG